jgi:DNA-binding Lrp family transcriptional regulator
MNRNRNAPHPHGRHGRGQVSSAIHEPLETNYTPAEASRLLVACLLQGLFAHAHEPDRLQSLLSKVDAILDGCLLEEPYQKILDGLQEALDAHRPLDGQLIRDLALYAGMEGQLLQLAEEQAVPSYAPYYAEKLRQARLYHSIRAKANQLYNCPESIDEVLPELDGLFRQLTGDWQSRHSMRTSIDLSELTPRPMEWLVKGLIPARHTTNLYGNSDTGKSLLALYLALCVIEGVPFFGFPTVKRGKVLYLDLEQDAEIQCQRWYAIARGAGYETPPEGLRYVRWTHGIVRHEAQLLRLIEQDRPALLIVDSFGKTVVKPLDPDHAIALYAFFDALDIPVVVIDHTAKANSEMPEDMAKEMASEYGTVYKRHYARSAIQVDKQDSEAGLTSLILRHKKNNFGSLAAEIPVLLSFVNDEEGSLQEVRIKYGEQVVLAHPELYRRRGEIEEYLADHPDQTQKEIAEGLNIDQSVVARVLTKLVKSGAVVVVSTKRPYRYRLADDYAFMHSINREHKCINDAPADSPVPEPAPDPPTGDADDYAFMHSINREHKCINDPPADSPAPEPASTPAYDPASESPEEWLERADGVLDQYAPDEVVVAKSWDEVEEWYKAMVSLRAGGKQLSFALEDGTYGTWN